MRSSAGWSLKRDCSLAELAGTFGELSHQRHVPGAEVKEGLSVDLHVCASSADGERGSRQLLSKTHIGGEGTKKTHCDQLRSDPTYGYSVEWRRRSRYEAILVEGSGLRAAGSSRRKKAAWMTSFSWTRAELVKEKR